MDHIKETGQVAAAVPTSIPIPQFVIKSSSLIWYYLHAVLQLIPGGQYVINYLNKSVHDDPYRTAVEITLILYGIYYYLSKPQLKKGLQSNRPNLSEKEINNLIDEWEPENIVDNILPEENWRLTSVPTIINSGIENYVSITRNNGKDLFEKVFNLSSNNFLQLSRDPSVIQRVKDTIRNYGVGACGPAGFYGNQDVHYTLEYDLSTFFGTEGAVLYGQDFCVSPSVLPAFSKRGDIIVADDQVSLSVQHGLQLSRATIYYYEHNNMEALDRLLTEINSMEAKENLPAIPRKFIVTEGLFHNTGDIAPLPELVQLKNKHKFRLFVDETFSLGVLGKTGRGITEHFHLERASSIDITVGSMATAFGSSGAFVLGDQVMTNHQHIGSNAYCFSASLPAYTTTTTSQVLKLMNEDNSTVIHLQKLSKSMHKFFKNLKLDKVIDILSNEYSPVLHFQLNEDFRKSKFKYTKAELFEMNQSLQKKSISSKFIEEYENEEKFLQNIVDEILAKWNILITRNTLILKHETLPIVPSLKICCNALMNEEELLQACEKIGQSLIELTK